MGFKYCSFSILYTYGRKWPQISLLGLPSKTDQQPKNIKKYFENLINKMRIKLQIKTFISGKN